MSTEKKLVIACFSGNDPTGGAGIQADIESLRHFNCHALPLITVNTVQDSQGIQECMPTETYFLSKQFECIRKDISLNAIKIGMLANIEQIELLDHLLRKETIPCIIDTIFSAGLGGAKASEEFINSFCKKLLPHAFVLTPNYLEAKKISNALKLNTETTPEKIAFNIANALQTNVLVTGTHYSEKNQVITHALSVSGTNDVMKFTNTRLPNSYHGSGCTLSSALAALLAKDIPIDKACKLALDYSFSSLVHAQALGRHQLFPSR